jgi:hypothetical protein
MDASSIVNMQFASHFISCSSCRDGLLNLLSQQNSSKASFPPFYNGTREEFALSSFQMRIVETYTESASADMTIKRSGNP